MATSGFVAFFNYEPYVEPSYVGFCYLFICKTLCRIGATSGFGAFFYAEPYIEPSYVGFCYLFKCKTLYRLMATSGFGADFIDNPYVEPSYVGFCYLFSSNTLYRIGFPTIFIFFPQKEKNEHPSVRFYSPSNIRFNFSKSVNESIS